MTIDYNFENVKIMVQSHTIREHKVLIKKKVTGLHRGTIGFATKGM